MLVLGRKYNQKHLEHTKTSVTHEHKTFWKKKIKTTAKEISGLILEKNGIKTKNISRHCLATFSKNLLIKR